MVFHGYVKYTEGNSDLMPFFEGNVLAHVKAHAKI